MNDLNSGNCCPICKTDDVTDAYSGPIRIGGPESIEREFSSVRNCSECEVQFLYPRPSSNPRYVPDPNNQSKYARKIGEQQRWVAKIGLDSFAHQTILEVGAGSGYFLDIVRTVASKCHAVEIEPACDSLLMSKADFVYRSVDEVPASSIEVAVSFDVLEHVSDPVELLRSVRSLLREEGILWVGVPNQHDYLLEIEPSYAPFFYHDSHLWYFNHRSLSRVAQLAGFEVEQIIGVHKYDFGNLVNWLSAKAPNGRVVSDELMTAGRSFARGLEETLRSSHLLVRLSKTT